MKEKMSEALGKRADLQMNFENFSFTRQITYTQYMLSQFSKGRLYKQEDGPV